MKRIGLLIGLIVIIFPTVKAQTTIQDNVHYVVNGDVMFKYTILEGDTLAKSRLVKDTIEGTWLLDGETVSYYSSKAKHPLRKYKIYKMHALVSSTTYFDNGQMKERITRINDSVFQKQVYYPNGIIKREGSFQIARIGTWNYYLPDGSMDCSIDYIQVNTSLLRYDEKNDIRLKYGTDILYKYMSLPLSCIGNCAPYINFGNLISVD
jgi:antitoxin component YwqK of YwqJK toxin-antitoxin module